MYKNKSMARTFILPRASRPCSAPNLYMRRNNGPNRDLRRENEVGVTTPFLASSSVVLSHSLMMCLVGASADSASCSTFLMTCEFQSRLLWGVKDEGSMVAGVTSGRKRPVSGIEPTMMWQWNQRETARTSGQRIESIIAAKPAKLI